jgi:ribosomal protein S18 acetylase RimI-like enzyme
VTRKPESIIAADVEALVDLFTVSGPFVSARTASDYWLYARLFSPTCLCVRGDDGRPVAAVLAFPDQSPGVDEIYIQDVAVHPEHRRLGYGELLLDELHRRATDWGVTRIWLTSEPANTGAIRLWAKFGYENPPADYQEADVWLTRDLKGPGRDRAVFERRTPVAASRAG